MKKLISLISLLFIFFTSFSQSQISGKVFDESSGESLIGATIIIKGTTHGTLTDINGNYSLDVPSGNQIISISYVSFNSKDIEISIGENESLDLNVFLSSNIELDEITIQGDVIKDNAIGLLNLQKKSINVQDGISSDEIKKMGASNAAESMNSVTGASIEDGKYLIIRGLSDRYSISQLNGITLPSSDPYKNSASLDLISSSFIESIIVSKTFTPDQPGNFTGGKIDISSKSIPEEEYFDFQISTSYNPQNNFEDYIADPAVNNGWIGYDNGSRRRPPTIFEKYNEYLKGGNAETTLFFGKNPSNEFERQLVDYSSKSLNNGFVPNKKYSFLNTNLTIGYGNKFSFLKKPAGINISMKYNHGYESLPNTIEGIYSAGGEENLIPEQLMIYNRGIEYSEIGGMIGLFYKISSTEDFSLTGIYNHNGSNEASSGTGYWRNTGAPSYETHSINYTERGLYNTILKYKKTLEKYNINWSLAWTHLDYDQPDYRAFGYVRDDIGNYIMNKSEVGRLPAHFWRALNDDQYASNLDLDFPLSDDYQIKVGGAFSYKIRQFWEKQFGHWKEPIAKQPGVNDSYISFIEANGDFDSYFSPYNYGVIGDPAINTSTYKLEYPFGNYYSDQTAIGNNYNGGELIWATYAMGISEWGNLKSILGVRLENTYLNTKILDPSKTDQNGEIYQMDILPSINLIYSLNDRSNLRFGASQTVARPNMREISGFASVGTPNEPVVLGNKDLQITKIINLDLRYEIFHNPGELIAFSAYYKYFDMPIVWLLTPKASTPEIIPVNASDANVYGVELEYRKSLNAISPNLGVGLNASYIFSKVKKDKSELEALLNSNRPDIKKWRPMSEQSPYIINAKINYNLKKLEWDNNLIFNIWGDRLTFITGALDPDVYERSRPSLDFITSKKFNRVTLGFFIQNILDMEYKKSFDFTGDYIYESFRKNRTYEINLKYRIK